MIAQWKKNNCNQSLCCSLLNRCAYCPLSTVVTKKIEARDEEIFQMRKSHIYATIKTFTDVMYNYCREKLNSPELFMHRIPYYAQLIEQKTGWLVSFVWGFIDGTLLKHAVQHTFKSSAIVDTNVLMGWSFNRSLLQMDYYAKCLGQFMKNGTIPTCFMSLSFYENYET